MNNFDFEFTTKSGNNYNAEVVISKYVDYGQVFTEFHEIRIYDDRDEISDEHEDWQEIMSLIESESYEIDSETIWNEFYVEDDIEI